MIIDNDNFCLCNLTLETEGKISLLVTFILLIKFNGLLHKATCP